MTQSEEEGEEKIDKRRISVTSDSTKSVILMSSEFQKEKEYTAPKKGKKKLKEIMTASFLNWVTLQTYRFKKLRELRRIHLKKALPDTTKSNCWNLRMEENCWKHPDEKWYTEQGNSNSVTCRFLIRNYRRRRGNEIFKVLQEKDGKLLIEFYIR